MPKIEAVSKSRKNEKQHFTYRGIEDIYNMIHPILSEYQVFSVPEVLEERDTITQTKGGGSMVRRIMRVKYTFYAKDGSCFSAVVAGEGMNAGDKAASKALSMAHKYLLIQVFAIPTFEGSIPPHGAADQQGASGSAGVNSGEQMRRETLGEEIEGFLHILFDAGLLEKEGVIEARNTYRNAADMKKLLKIHKNWRDKVQNLEAAKQNQQAELTAAADKGWGDE